MTLVDDEAAAVDLGSAPMSPPRRPDRQPVRVALVAAGTAVMVAAGVWLGRAATSGGGHDHGPSPVAAAAPVAGPATPATAAVDHSAHGGMAAAPPTSTVSRPPVTPAPVAGGSAGATQVVATPVTGGYRLSILEAPPSPGSAGTLRFVVEGPDGAPVSEFLVAHERPMHLIVVREDLAHFQHLHPEQGDDGVWRQALSFPEPGRYRIFADFVAATGAAGTPATVVADVATGDRVTAPLPPPSAIATVDGYRIQLEGRPMIGQDRPLRFTVTKDGVGVQDLEPYLGALGHLVVLRASDLAYVHAHPTGTGGPGGAVPFGVLFPSAGDYRLYLQFQHRGAVRTAEFTVTV